MLRLLDDRRHLGKLLLRVLEHGRRDLRQQSVERNLDALDAGERLDGDGRVVGALLNGGVGRDQCRVGVPESQMLREMPHHDRQVLHRDDGVGAEERRREVGQVDGEVSLVILSGVGLDGQAARSLDVLGDGVLLRRLRCRDQELLGVRHVHALEEEQFRLA